MRKTLLTWKTCLALTLVSGAAALHAQSAPAATMPSIDVAVTFVAQHSLKATTTQSFWLEGGSLEVGVPVWRGFGVAGDFTGGQTNSIGNSGVPLVLETFAVGPRYRWHPEGKFSVYGQALVGVATGSRSVFPSSTGSTASATSFSQQYGGGVDLKVTQHFSLRAIEAAYLRTTLPNGSNNEQNLLRLGAGFVFRFHP